MMLKLLKLPLNNLTPTSHTTAIQADMTQYIILDSLIYFPLMFHPSLKRFLTHFLNKFNSFFTFKELILFIMVEHP